MSSLDDAFSLSSILCFVVITTITFVFSKKLSNAADSKADGVAEAEAEVCCANCGMPEVDDIKLEECTDCDLVKYCGDECREKHREKHDEECKNRKASLLRDRKLFTQPEGTHLGECPICFLPMPIDPRKYIFWSCCSETICKGCLYANTMSNKHDRVKASSCPFCREPANDDENRKRMMVRVKANDPAALNQMGAKCYDEGDCDGAFEYWTKAAELCDIEAHSKLGCIYYMGEGVEKDEEKTVYHWEKAAIGGHPGARHGLACIEERNGNIERSVKHLIIGANLGEEKSMKKLWDHYSKGNITKEELDATLRAHRAAIDETKSEQREAAEKVVLRLRSLGV